MNTTDNKSIIIDGDKSLFLSKSAICRFKKDLRDNNKERLSINNYLSKEWTYNIISNTDTEIKIKLVKDDTKELVQVKDETKELVKDKTKELVVLEQDEKRKLLKEKLKIARMNKLSPMQMKQNLRNKVPADVLDAYLELKKVQLKVPVPPPDIVLSKPDEFKKIIHTMVQSFGMFKGNNNPVVNYYKLLAKHLGLPTTFEPPTQQTEEPIDQTNEFIKMLRKQRETKINDDVDDEMKEIYKSLGIDMKGLEKQKEDNEMKEIYKSLGINIEDSRKQEEDNEMKEIYKSLGIELKKKETIKEDDEMKEIYKSLDIEVETQEVDTQEKEETIIEDDEMKEIYKSLGIEVERQEKESIKEDDYIFINV